MIKDRLEPEILSLITTEQCSAACCNCCFQCSPKLHKRMTLEEIFSYVDMARRDFPLIKSCVFTGGECTLLGDDLVKAIKYARENGFRCRIVSNASWAVSEERAFDYLSVLKSAGLEELNLSTGDEHQAWVAYDNIVYACQAAVRLGLWVAVSVESTPDSSFTSKVILQDTRIAPDVLRGRIVLKDSLWIEFDKLVDTQRIDHLNSGPCPNLFNTLSISPYGHLQACCGLTSKDNIYLDLGDTKNYSFRRLYDEQFDDLVKIWLFTHGPKDIYSYLCKQKGIEEESYRYPHLCSLCHHILSDKENMKIIKNDMVRLIPTIILKYQFIYKTITCENETAWTYG